MAIINKDDKDDSVRYVSKQDLIDNFDSAVDACDDFVKMNMECARFFVDKVVEDQLCYNSLFSEMGDTRTMMVLKIKEMLIEFCAPSFEGKFIECKEHRSYVELSKKIRSLEDKMRDQMRLLTENDEAYASLALKAYKKFGEIKQILSDMDILEKKESDGDK